MCAACAPRTGPTPSSIASNLKRDTRAIESREELAPLARAGEIAAFGLRMNAGWPFDQFQQVTGYDLRERMVGRNGSIVRHAAGAQITPDRFQLTPQGLRFADAAAELFLR